MPRKRTLELVMRLLLVQKNTELIYKNTKTESEKIIMENKKFAANKENISIVDGKVVIDSEELAAAIQDYSVDATAAEEDYLNFCIVIER